MVVKGGYEKCKLELDDVLFILLSKKRKYFLILDKKRFKRGMDNEFIEFVVRFFVRVSWFRVVFDEV